MTTPADPKSGLLRAVAVLNLLAGRAPEPLGVSTVARELDLAKAVAHRILKEFTAATYLVFDERTRQYRLGPGALTLGLAALRDLDVPRIARPRLEQLVTTAGETATLSVRTGWCRTYVDQVLSPHEIRMSITLGTSHPLHAGSSSKVILAHLSDSEIDQYLRMPRRERLTPHTITNEAELREELVWVRTHGYAVSAGERQAGASSVAAPVHRATGEVFGSVSLCVPQDRFSAAAAQDYNRLVVQASAQVSADLGYQTPSQN